ncbi:DOMON-like domain-containing protein [Cyanobium sp. FACHB-13342]|uniref:DOMON-like domain-containing protein n=1 Tax=Cyanobium sp. FACHB-13342 TaxID=2692793 RepID=UPI0016804EB5|nr:DOMON-like domain-containing protein [Cyanobium sp. FACHB-13342]MBD2423339.1 DOMON-like domain-containing protein [Cyanobium sp. FACHB-13342]
MSPQPICFALVPFAHPSQHSTEQGTKVDPPELSIGGHLGLEAGLLELTYILEGDLEQLQIAPAVATPERRDLLWQTTCLELFLARQGAQDYWEFNLSPSGHWNVYHLEGYRQGLRPELAYQELPVQLTRSEHQLLLTLRCPLPPALLPPNSPPADGPGALEIGITAVLEHRDGAIGYWALQHPGAEADFHHRGGFCITLP